MAPPSKPTQQPKIPLPAFLKMLSTVPQLAGAKGMAIAGKIYKSYNTEEALSTLTDVSLEEAGVGEKEERRLILVAVQKAGYKLRPKVNPSSDAALAASSLPTPVSTRRKRRRDEDLNHLLPTKSEDEDEHYGSLEFDEILDAELLKGKSTVVNRAPLMTAWACVVAERMGFLRQEALSIATAYTEINAISKGNGVRVTDKHANGKQLQTEAAQPYIELMGRRVPLYRTQNQEWRALADGKPVSPGRAHRYITQAFQRSTPHILGALRVLAGSYSAAELNERGFALYADFRPEVRSWGERGSTSCDTILALRKSPQRGKTDGRANRTSDGGGPPPMGGPPADGPMNKMQPEPGAEAEAEEPPAKKAKTQVYDGDDTSLFADLSAEDLAELP